MQFFKLQDRFGLRSQPATAIIGSAMQTAAGSLPYFSAEIQGEEHAWPRARLRHLQGKKMAAKSGTKTWFSGSFIGIIALNQHQQRRRGNHIGQRPQILARQLDEAPTCSPISTQQEHKIHRALHRHAEAH